LAAVGVRKADRVISENNLYARRRTFSCTILWQSYVCLESL